MDEKVLEEKLNALKTGLEGKSKEQAQAEIKAFEAEIKEEIKNESKAVKEDFNNELNEIKGKFGEFAVKSDIEAVQKHLDQIDVKLQEKGSVKKESKSINEEINEVIEKNFDSIKSVRRGMSAKMEVKVVGDMTLGNHLTGDQPRDYSNNVIMTPSPLINFTDLVGGVINITGGTYTFPQETGSEGAIATQTEGAAKSQIDYDLTMQDVTTDFLAGYATYSKKMANNLPFLQSFIPQALRRDYLKAENSKFNTALAAAALASTVTAGNKIERIIDEIARLEALDNPVNAIVVRPEDWWDIQVIEKSTGAGYGLPGVVAYTNGMLYVNGIPVYKATWLAADKYYVGDFSRVKKVVTEGLSLEFSTENEDNFIKNNITARIESQIGLAYERSTAVIYGDFTSAP